MNEINLESQHIRTDPETPETRIEMFRNNCIHVGLLTVNTNKRFELSKIRSLCKPNVLTMIKTLAQKIVRYLIILTFSCDYILKYIPYSRVKLSFCLFA